MRNLRESNIDGPSYGFNNRLVSEFPANFPEIICRVSAGRLSRLRLVERPGHLSPGQLCPIAIAQGVRLDAVIAISFSKLIQTNRKKEDMIFGESQNLRDKEIIEFIGDDIND